MNSTPNTGDRLEGHALVAEDDGKFNLRDVQTAPLTPRTIGIKTKWSGISFGTEFAVLTKKLDWGPFPLTTGYMGAGVVTHVGEQVEGYSVGERVYYRRNAELTLVDGGSINCAAGVHASVAVLDPTGDHGADHIPNNVSDDLASMFVLPAVGLTGVNQAQVGVGDRVVVIGVGMIGLAVVAAAVARGAHVLAVDIRDHSLKVARGLGADHTVNARESNVPEVVRSVFDGDGVDFVFESTGHRDSIDMGITLLREFGCFVWQGNYGEEPISFHFLEAHRRRIRMVFPCDDGYRPARQAVMTSLASGWLDWNLTMTDRIEASDSPDFYKRIYEKGLGDVLGASVRWEE